MTSRQNGGGMVGVSVTCHVVGIANTWTMVVEKIKIFLVVIYGHPQSRKDTGDIGKIWNARQETFGFFFH